MTLPEGFKATLFAGEPDVRQPIALTIDHRGRLWVAENYSYPSWLQKPTEDDRILVFDDTDGDGHFDRRTVFWSKRGANLSGLAVGFGGVWACATPDLLFIPDRDGDVVPDGPAQVELDGWDVKAGHTLPNALIWGPDGWLWGCNGIQANSRVGRLGTPDSARVAINCGVWRYHPTRRVFEAVAHGTTNPWGLDFDDHGEAFITNCVIPHLWRVVPGARFQRMYGQDFNPHSYALMESCADHIHWAGGRWQDSREGRGKHGEAGGGHAHVGAMVYLGDNWPDRYRDSILMSNIHGHRVNRDTLSRVGAGYVARHGQDFLMANDPWFRGMGLQCGPDGAVFLADWCDTGECHETDADGAHRENGRVFRVAYGTPRPVRIDLSKLSDDELVQMQLHKNDWYVRNARRILQERAAAGRDLGQSHRALREILDTNPDATRKLRALWALHATGGLGEANLRGLLGHAEEWVRSWSVRLLVDAGEPGPDALARFATMAGSDPSPLVRLSLASALQRIAVPRRWAMAEGLVGHSEDARDRELPLMIWYGVEPLAASDRARAVALAKRCAIPVVRQYLARRLVAADLAGGLAALVAAIQAEAEPTRARDLITGMLDAVRGRRRVAMPEDWPAVYESLAKSPDPDLREQSTLLALAFDDPNAVKVLRALMADRTAPADGRRRALQALAEKRVPGLAADLRALLDQPPVRGAALRALAAFDDPATPGAILRHYANLTGPERDDAVATLASRPSYARALLEALGRGAVPRRDVSAATARQLLAFGDRAIAGTLEKVWGSARPATTEKAAVIAKYKALLTPDRLKSADLARGRSIFERTCAPCHHLFESGGDVGPDLTGSDRANLVYILENVVDPGASVGRDYQLTTVATADGRLISGIIRQQDGESLTIQTANERIVVPREDVEAMKSSPASMMPEGIFDKLTDEEVVDLVAYLATPAPLPKSNSGR
jgi:putative membrane-bound dehydrogenase-like protein